MKSKKQKSPADPWRSQSAVTQVGPSAPAIDDLPSSLEGLRKISQKLVSHYMGSSDGLTGPITGERLKEVDLRYADAMFARLLEMGPPKLSRERPPDQQIAGCCRDFTVLYVAMARRKGIPARVRMGYATYFMPDWYLDHVIAEVWDTSAKRWRLIEPEITDAFAAQANLDPLDVPSDRFVTGPRAWLAARSGQIDPERCVVASDLEIPYTRSWLSLRHHVVQDLAALNKAEMVLWDEWGILEEKDPLNRAEMLDLLAQDISDSNCTIAKLTEWSEREGLRIPPTVTSYSPAYSSPLKVDVTRVLEGTIPASI
jgi:transglutaminase superfamily protein